MQPPLWIGAIGTLIFLAFLLNGLRLVRGTAGHAANAGALHIGMASIALPVMWVVILVAALG
ncbi:hypothetical protein [uncultured Erythrobacter sp.]|uniref:hypothetical protein n=1 Tax=uncultured Erythrobacter sp. TaxID=263913 RepID=UPI002633D532|nr:hypothetical protein [uncultured Erythrobacter sp.]